MNTLFSFSDELWLAGLFLSAFIAATLLPGASEVLLIAALLNGKDPVTSVFAATLGNVLGAVTTFYIGLWVGGNAGRYLGISDEKRQRSGEWISRYGSWVLIFSWVPVIGDPLVLAAGMLGMKTTRFLIFMTMGKAGRYLLVAWLTLGAEYLWL
ncbi:DedA family protein [Desulfobotulus sp. H1]|uniref:DedA family protein n=1 Tax=Desulfobotulus pelophilus TaxID=2823377 RepID=A0ABT3NA23_9BACT|nr:YqaA family protein [Desulfobotulus pelophilus]MCW7754310.1 DedA family protein [Desulfobotulus pelophilus]